MQGKYNNSRIIALIVSLAFLLITIPFPVYSASPLWTGSGTADDPYIITTASGLAALATDVNNGNSYINTYFALGNDINLSTIGNWTPIGGRTTTRAFSGNFDGRHHKILNIKITLSNPIGNNYYGLFGYTSNATINNLTMSNTTFNSSINSPATVYFGSFVGYDAGNTVLYNCGVALGTFDINKADNHSEVNVGGIIGYLASNSFVINCFNNASIVYPSGNRNDYFYGGIAGFNGGTVYNCYNTSTINTDNGDINKANQDPISGNHEVDTPNYYDSTKYGSSSISDGSIPMTTQQMQSQVFADVLNSNIENLPSSLPVTPEQLDTWGTIINEYPSPQPPSTTKSFDVNFSSCVGIKVSGNTSAVTLPNILSGAVPVTLDSVTVSSALSGLLAGQAPALGSGKLAIALGYNGNNIFLTNGMTVGQTVISSSVQAPEIIFSYYVDSQMATLLDGEVITATLKSVANIPTYYVFKIKITTEQISASGQALYKRGRQYDNIASTSSSPIQADSCFTVQFLTNYNPSKMGDVSTRPIILTTSSSFPVGTKFTLVDKTDIANIKYYYYICSGVTNSIDLNNFLKMGVTSGAGYLPPTYNETKIENLIFVVDYSSTNKSAISSDIYLRHTINNSETDMQTTIPKVQCVIGTDSPSVTLNASNTTINANEVMQLQLNVSASHTKTIYDEQKYSVVLSSNIAFPYGTKVMIGSTIYNIEDGNKKVILPIGTEGTYNITIDALGRGFTEDFALTANLYSAPDALYPYTTAEPITTDTENITILGSISAIKASIADTQRMIPAGSNTPLDFTVQTIDSGNNSNVRVTLYKKESDIGFNYTETSSATEFSVASGSTTWRYTPVTSWDKGIYRFVFDLLDSNDNVVKSTSVNVICYE